MKTKILIFVAIITVIVIFAVLIYLFFGRKNNKQKYTQRPVRKRNLKKNTEDPYYFILAGWVTSRHSSLMQNHGQNISMLTDLIIGFGYYTTDTTQPLREYNQNGWNDTAISLCAEYMKANPQGRIWIFPEFDPDVYYKIIGIPDHDPKNPCTSMNLGPSQVNTLVKIVADRFGAAGLNITGFVIDVERNTFGGQIQPCDGFLLVNLLKQLRAYNSSLNLVANLSSYNECWDKNLYEKSKAAGTHMWCNNGPSGVSYKTFLDMEGAYMSVQTYGATERMSYCDMGCGPENYEDQDPNTVDWAFDTPLTCCTLDLIKQSLWQKINFTAGRICDHIAKFSQGQDFIGNLTPAQRRKVGITTYPTTPQGLQQLYEKIIFPFGMGGYTAFDAIYMNNIPMDIVNNFKAVVQEIQNKINQGALNSNPDFSLCGSLINEINLPCGCTSKFSGNCGWATVKEGTTCQPVTLWDCNPVTNTCHPDPIGPYKSLSDCLTNSKCTPWDCNPHTKKCHPDPSGPYGTFDDCIQKSNCKNT